MSCRSSGRALSIAFVVALLGAACVAPTSGADLVLRDVRVVDVRSGEVRAEQAIVVRGERIVAVGPTLDVEVPSGARVIDGGGRFVVPGLWDMHTHSRRARRAELHDPLYVAHGVTGVRDMGTHLASALALRERAPDPLAPRVVFTSPPVDGVPPVLSFGLAAEDAAAARALVALLDAQGFDTIKVYDRLSREAYFALADEAERRGLRLVGHVPLAVTPLEAVRAGQDDIEHLTLVLEAAIPGALAWTAADAGGDSMALLVDGRLAAALPTFDDGLARELFAALAEHEVWQTPTLVQMRGAFSADVFAESDDPRLAWVPAATADDWRAVGRETPPAELAAGRAVYERQKRLVGELHRAGVPLLAGTDTSDEPWVFAGASLHDELALLVEAGLTPLEALRTATLHPALARGDADHEGFVGVGATADLLLLDGDPTQDVGHLARPHAVCLRGRWLDRAALDALVAEAIRRAAARGA